MRCKKSNFIYFRVNQKLDGRTLDAMMRHCHVHHMIISSQCPCGGIGRRAGFKIQYLLDVSVRVRPGAPLDFFVSKII